MSSRRQAIQEMEEAVRDTSPSARRASGGNFTRRTKSVRSFSGETISPEINVEAIMEQIKDISDSKLREEIDKLTKIIEVYRKINVLKNPPAPIGVAIPDVLPSSEDYYKYATEYLPYAESYCDIEDEPLVLEDRNMTMLSMFAYLYNAKKMSKKEGESPVEFFEKCKDATDQTLMLFRENAKAKGLDLPAYINEMNF